MISLANIIPLFLSSLLFVVAVADNTALQLKLNPITNPIIKHPINPLITDKRAANNASTVALMK